MCIFYYLYVSNCAYFSVYLGNVDVYNLVILSNLVHLSQLLSLHKGDQGNKHG